MPQRHGGRAEGGPRLRAGANVGRQGEGGGMTMAAWAAAEGIGLTTQARAAGEFLEARGLHFLVDFGVTNAVERAATVRLLEDAEGVRVRRAQAERRAAEATPPWPVIPMVTDRLIDLG